MVVPVIPLAISLVCNLLGRVAIARLLTGATMNSARIGVALFVAGLAAAGLGVALLSSRAAGGINSIRNNRNLLKRRFAAGVGLVTLAIWIYAVLIQFQIYDSVAGGVVALLGARWSLGAVSLSPGDILVFILALWFSVLLSRLVRFILNEDVLPRVPLPRGVPATISVLTNYVILTVGSLFALAAAGIELSRIAFMAGALGVGIGFGLQNIVSNFVSGLILMFERPIQIGDTIQMGALFGEVRRIGIRSSVVRTFDGAEVIVPNTNLVANEVTNWTLSDRMRRIELPVGVAYGTDPDRVLKILVDVAGRHPEVLKEPEAAALFFGFGDSSLNFSLRCWTGQFERFLVVRSDLFVAVNHALSEAGIEIPFPQRDLHLRSVAEGIGPVLPAPREPAGSGSKKPDEGRS